MRRHGEAMSPHAHAQSPSVAASFARRFPSSRRNARRARHLAVGQLAAWGVPEGGELGGRAALIVSELASNAVTHGHVPGRDFEVRLTLTPAVMHIEVTDGRTGSGPPAGRGALAPARPGAESGRGLVLVDALADRWGVETRTPAPGKTVWAEVDRGGV